MRYPEKSKAPLDEKNYQRYYSQFVPWRGRPLFFTGGLLGYLFGFVVMNTSIRLPETLFFTVPVICSLGWLDGVRNMIRYNGVKETNEKTYVVLPWKGRKLFGSSIAFWTAYWLPFSLPGSVYLAIGAIAILLSLISLCWYYVYAIDILKKSSA